MFNNVTLFVFPACAEYNPATIGAALSQNLARPCGPRDLETLGFEPLSRVPGDPLILKIEGLDEEVYGFCAGGWEKTLPKQVIKQKTDEALEAFMSSHENPPNKEQLQQISEEVNILMLEGTFAKQFRVECMIDFDNGWLAIGCLSGKRAEGVASALRNALSTFPTRLVQPKVAPQAILTAWLREKEAPLPFELGDDCDLVSMEGGKSWRGRQGDLDGVEVETHLAGGMVAVLLGLKLNDITFAVDNSMHLRNIKKLDFTRGEEAGAEMEEFMVYARAVMDLIPEMRDHFGLERMEPVSMEESAANAASTNFFENLVRPADITYTDPEMETQDASM